MIRLLAICLTTIMLVGCQHPNSTPTYDPFAAAGSQRIPPPATGFNQSSGYQGAPSYQPPITQQPPAAVPPTNNYQPPVSYQAPSLTVPQIQSAPPATGFPPTNSSPATLQPVSPNSGVHWDYSTPATATASRSTPTPRATPSWPPRRPLRQSDQLTWSDPQVPGGVRHAAAQIPYGNSTGANRIPTLAPATLTVRPSVVRSNSIAPIPGRVAAYDEAYLQPSVVPYPANQSYGVADQWRSRQR
jgi:hypothetical protein